MDAPRRTGTAAPPAGGGTGGGLKPAPAAAATSYGSFGGGGGAAHPRPKLHSHAAATYHWHAPAAASGRAVSTAATAAVTEAALDGFFVSAYDYWRGGGAVAIAAAAGARLLLTLVLAAVVPTAITFVDYAALGACHDAGSCGPLTRFFTTAHVRSPRPAEAVSALLTAAHAAHLAGLAWTALTTAAAAWRMRRFYAAVLGVPDAAALTALSWDDVVRRLQGAVVARAAARRLAFHQAAQQAGGGGDGGGGVPLPPVVPLSGPLGRVLSRLVELQAEYEGHLGRQQQRQAEAAVLSQQQRTRQRQAHKRQSQQQPGSTKTGGVTAWPGGAVELTRRARAPTGADDPRPSVKLPSGAAAGAATVYASSDGVDSLDALEAFLAAPAAAGATPPTSDPRGAAHDSRQLSMAAAMAAAPELPASLTGPASDGSVSHLSGSTVPESDAAGGGGVRVVIDESSADNVGASDESPQQVTPPTSPSDEDDALLSPRLGGDALGASRTVAVGGHPAPPSPTGVAVVGDRTLVSPVSAQAVACRIMRYDNYLVALLDEEGDTAAGGGSRGGGAATGPVLRTSLCAAGSGGGGGWRCSPLRLLLCCRRRTAYAHVPSGEASDQQPPTTPQQQLPQLWLPFTDSLEWALRKVLLDPLLSPHRTLRAPFTAVDAGAAAAHLRRRFIAAGLLGLAAAPVALLLRALAHVAAVSQEAHATRDVLGPRGWSPYAAAALREYNELPHVFQRRMAAAAPAAARYLREFPPSPGANALGRLVASLAGAALTLLLGAALVDDALLVHVTVGSHNLLFVSAALGAVLAAARALTSESWHGTLQPEAALSELAAQLHFMPRRWWHRARSPAVRAEVAALFQYRAVLFLADVAGALTTPLALLFLLPPQADALVAFLRRATVQREGLGAMCARAVFDDDDRGDGGGGDIAGSGSVSDAEAPPSWARRAPAAGGPHRREARRSRQPSAQRPRPAVTMVSPETALPRVPAPEGVAGGGVRYAAQPRLPLQPAAAGAGAVSSKMAASIMSFRVQHPRG